tara:strand:- start:508 stop:1233 length:726 start_codon:yes stop_codon:yes gene_type:complete
MHIFGYSQAPTRRNAQKGFTLLEVLLAIGVTAMIGLGSWQILNSAIRASESTQTRLAELNALQKTMLIISRDLRQVMSRSIRDGFGDYQPALTTKNEFYILEFSRVGWRNPMDDVRSNIQRVAYELNENKLIRHYWDVLDRSQDSSPISKELLSEVDSISLRFVNKNGGWTDEWPSTSGSSSSAGASAATDPRASVNELPKAVEISFDLQRFGKVKRLYDLPDFLENIAMPVTTPPPSGGG